MTLLEKLNIYGFEFLEELKDNHEHRVFLSKYMNDINLNLNALDFKLFYSKYRNNTSDSLFLYYLFKFKPEDMFYNENGEFFVNKYTDSSKELLFKNVTIFNYLNLETNNVFVRKCFEAEKENHEKVELLVNAIKDNKNLDFFNFKKLVIDYYISNSNITEDEIKNLLLDYIEKNKNSTNIKIAINYYSNHSDDEQFVDFFKKINPNNLSCKEHIIISEHIESIFRNRKINLKDIDLSSVCFYSLLKHKANDDFYSMANELFSDASNIAKTIDDNTKEKLIKYIIENFDKIHDGEDKIMRIMDTSSELISKYILDERVLKINKHFPLHFIFSLNIDSEIINSVKLYLENIIGKDTSFKRFNNNLNDSIFLSKHNLSLINADNKMISEIVLKKHSNNKIYEYFKAISFDLKIEEIVNNKKNKDFINLFLSNENKDRFLFIIEDDYSAKRVYESFSKFSFEEKKDLITSVYNEVFHPFDLNKHDIISLLKQKESEEFLKLLIEKDNDANFNEILINYLDDDNEFKKEIVRRKIELNLPIEFDF